MLYICARQSLSTSILSSKPITAICKCKPNLPLRITAGSTRSYRFVVPMQNKFYLKRRSSIIVINIAVARSAVPEDPSVPLSPNMASISSMMTRC